MHGELLYVQLYTLALVQIFLHSLFMNVKPSWRLHIQFVWSLWIWTTVMTATIWSKRSWSPRGKKTRLHLVYQTISHLTFTEFLTLWVYTHWPPNGSRLGKPGRGRTPSSDLCLLIVRATLLLMFSTCSDFLCLLARFKRESRPVVQVVQLFLVPFPRYSGGWGTGRASLSHLVMDPPGWDVVRRAIVWAHISPHRRFTLEKFRCQ